MIKIFLVFIVLISSIIVCFAENENYNVYNYQSNSLPKTQSDTILFIIDFSNSMNEYLGGARKIDIAIDTLGRILSQVNSNVKMGLRIYGHKHGFNQILGCRASDLSSPILPNNAKNIYSQLININPSGWTPITYSLKQAVNNDFQNINGLKRIILLTDGGETCDESPCEYAMKLIETRDDIKIDVIAFAINDAEAEAQLKCAALATYGKIYTANDAESLARSLENAVSIEKNVQGTIIKK